MYAKTLSSRYFTVSIVASLVDLRPFVIDYKKAAHVISSFDVQDKTLATGVCSQSNNISRSDYRKTDPFLHSSIITSATHAS